MTATVSVRIRGKPFKVDQYRKLDLSNQGITHMAEIEGLEGVTNIWALDLSNNQIAKLEGLEGLVNLQRLYILGNRIAKLEGLCKLANLKVLVLSQNSITKLEGLEKLMNLESLNLNNNRIAKLEGLESLANLQQLYLSQNRIAKLEGLEGLTRLEKFTIAGNLILWPPGISRDSPAQDFVGYCRESQARGPEAQQPVKTEPNQKTEAEERERLAKFKKLVRASEELTIKQVARYLGLSEEETFDRLVDWASQFGFVLVKDTVKFGAGRKDDFIASLDKEFESWSATSKKE